MTKTQFLALMAASGVGFVGGATVDFTGGANPSAKFVHALRIVALQLEDGGLSSDVITAYRTLATPETDGGVDLQDIGEAECTGDTAPARTWVRNNCLKPDGGAVTNVYVIEARPTGVDDGGQGDVAVEVYGDVAVKCTLAKPVAFKNFLNSLTCVNPRRRSGTNPL